MPLFSSERYNTKDGHILCLSVSVNPEWNRVGEDIVSCFMKLFII